MYSFQNVHICINWVIGKSLYFLVFCKYLFLIENVTMNFSLNRCFIASSKWYQYGALENMDELYIYIGRKI